MLSGITSQNEPHKHGRRQDFLQEGANIEAPRGEGSGREYPPPQPTKGLGERREFPSPQRGPGRSPSRRRVFWHITGSGTASGRKKIVYSKAKKIHKKSALERWYLVRQTQ